MSRESHPDPGSLTAFQSRTNPSEPDLTAATLSPQTVKIPHYGLTHPKAYLGYTLALAAADTQTDPETLTNKHVIGTPQKARAGAANLGLITPENGNPNSDRLTTTGTRIRNHAIDTYGSLTAALEHFDTLRGTNTRLTTIDNWGTITDSLIENDPAATKLITHLKTIHTERNDPPNAGIPLPELVHELYYEDPAFAVELLIRDNDHIRNQLVDTGTFNHELLTGPAAYRGAGVYQFKNILYHLGALTTRGADTTSLSPTDDIWALETEYRGDL